MAVIPSSMKAAICKEPGSVIVEEVPVPKPGARELLVKVKYASLCHSDLSIIDGAFGTMFFPVVIGHEALSTVESIGNDAAGYGFKVGDIIGAPLWHNMCLSCANCSVGPEFCGTMSVKGLTMDGYFAEYSVVDAASAVLVHRNEPGTSPPANLNSLAPLFCAGITVWDALERAKIAPGETIAIVGAGGLGGIAIKYAAGLGARVVALDVRDEQLEISKGPNGAWAGVNTAKIQGAELATHVKTINGGKLFDVVIVTSGAEAAYASALPLVAPLGRLIVVGLPHNPMDIPASLVTSSCISIIGAKVPGAAGAKRCLDFSLRSGILPKINPRKFKLEDLDEMIGLMKEGKVEEGRMVVHFE